MFKHTTNYLKEPVDNIALVLFRFCYGFLIAAEGFGAIATGWVRRTFIDPEFTFSYIWIDWLQPLPGDGMYYYYVLMGLSGIMIMLGLFYRFSSVLFFLLWTGAYLMQKTNYNNHYYLLVLLSASMALFPAHRSHSLDVRLGLTSPTSVCYRLYLKFFVVQIVIVYLFAAWNKIYPDWLNAIPIHAWFQTKAGYPIIGPLLGEKWFAYVISWGGILFDAGIGFLLLFRPTRKYGFYLSLIFHLFNSVVFQIGIFPYLMIALSAFFYPPEMLRKRFSFIDVFSNAAGTSPAIMPRFYVFCFVVYFLVQLYLPLRHYRYQGDVLATDEGHKMSWRMMLRYKSGYAKYKIVDKASGHVEWDRGAFLTPKQRRKAAGSPDMCWQYVQFLKNKYQEAGREVEIYAHTRVGVNGSEKFMLIDTTVNLADRKWDYFSHSDWILTPKIERHYTSLRQ